MKGLGHSQTSAETWEGSRVGEVRKGSDEAEGLVCWSKDVGFYCVEMGGH